METYIITILFLSITNMCSYGHADVLMDSWRRCANQLHCAPKVVAEKLQFRQLPIREKSRSAAP